MTEYEYEQSVENFAKYNNKKGNGMTANEYKKQIKDYSINMLSFEKEECLESIKYLNEDIKDELDSSEADDYIINKAKKNLEKMSVKMQIINDALDAITTSKKLAEKVNEIEKNDVELSI